MRMLGLFSAACAATAIIAAHNVAAHGVILILLITFLPWSVIVSLVFCLARRSLSHHQAAVIATRLHPADVVPHNEVDVRLFTGCCLASCPFFFLVLVLVVWDLPPP